MLVAEDFVQDGAHFLYKVVNLWWDWKTRFGCLLLNLSGITTRLNGLYLSLWLATYSMSVYFILLSLLILAHFIISC